MESSSRNGDVFYESTLGWIWFPGSAPSGAVSFWNAYGNRWEYPCKVSDCSAGYYSPSRGPYCFYPYGNKEYSSSQFWILVNGHNFESLSWREDSFGDVPPNSINTCAGTRLYVGKNKYGLGKVDSKNKAFFLGYQGKEYWYKYYDVLIIKKDYRSQTIDNARYNFNQGSYTDVGSLILTTSKVNNYECSAVKKITSLAQMVQNEHSWDIGMSISSSVNFGMTIGIPDYIGVSWGITKEKHFDWRKGSTQSESVTFTEQVEVNVPPNHSCEVEMYGMRKRGSIPFTATATRYYRNGETRSATVQGVSYNTVVAQVQTVVRRCIPIPDVTPCDTQVERR
ncbi:natterin-4-like [Varanus komodoensis]|uniref:natterin-4-like n=1 Tax=Varanus komodoensis TaxID=61221 RepID=UPI001CF77F42|nr:natterin-4-like [Varanus komodoensis]